MSQVWVTDDAREIEKFILFLANNPTQILTNEKGFDFSVLRKSNRTLSNQRTKVLSIQERHFISFGIIIIRCVLSVRVQQFGRMQRKQKKQLIKNGKLRKISNDKYIHYVLRDCGHGYEGVCILLDEIRTFLGDPETGI